MSKTASKTGKMLILYLEIFTHVYLEESTYFYNSSILFNWIYYLLLESNHSWFHLSERAVYIITLFTFVPGFGPNLRADFYVVEQGPGGIYNTWLWVDARNGT